MTIILEGGCQTNRWQENSQACPSRFVLRKPSPIDEGRNDHDAATDSKQPCCKTAKESDHDKNEPEGHKSGPDLWRNNQLLSSFFIESGSSRITQQVLQKYEFAEVLGARRSRPVFGGRSPVSPDLCP